VHLEYILTEMFKNAFRATIETFYKRHGESSSEQIPPVIVTISPASVPDHSHRTFLSLRIRDQGGGISSSNMSNVFSYAFTTAGSPDENWEDDDAKDSRASRQADGDISVNEAPMFAEISRKGLQVGMGTIAGLGYGLPMSRLYAKYFGGSLDVVTLHGWGACNRNPTCYFSLMKFQGSDVFVKLRCLDEAGGSEI
jgi:26S proteasome regulatory subunit T1